MKTEYAMTAPIILIIFPFVIYIFGDLTDGAERLRRRREDRRSGSLQEAVRSSSLMGGLCKRTHSKMLGKQAERHPMGRALPIVFHCHCPLYHLLFVGRDILKSSPHLITMP